MNLSLDCNASLAGGLPLQWLEPKQGNRIGWKPWLVDEKEFLSEYIDTTFDMGWIQNCEVGVLRIGWLCNSSLRILADDCGFQQYVILGPFKIPQARCKAKRGSILAQETQLGWSWSGPELQDVWTAWSTCRLLYNSQVDAFYHLAISETICHLCCGGVVAVLWRQQWGWHLQGWYY